MCASRTADSFGGFSIAMNDQKTAITPRRDQDFPEWYQQVIRAADLAENSDVRGCMVIKPWGYGMWEKMQRALDGMFKATGHKNAYFPLFIPLSYLEKEAAHVEGFAKECAVVTHHRLEVGPDGKLRPAPAAELAEPLVVRPDQRDDHRRDLREVGAVLSRSADPHQPMGERRPLGDAAPPFSAHGGVSLAGRPHRARDRSRGASRRRRKCCAFTRHSRAIISRVPVLSGEKSESERFPGAVQTLCIEAMVQDRKAIQAGTSHFLGQNFSKASGIKFQSREGREEFAWTTSWGVSTRLIGTLIMAHADDDGMVIPPRIAPTHVGHPPDHAEARYARRGARGGATKLRRRAARRGSSTAARWRWRSTPAISAAARRAGNGSRKACRCELRSARAT